MSDQTPVVNVNPTGKRLSVSALVSTITGVFTYAIYLLAWILDFSTLWALILAPISAIVAIVSGHKGKREIRRSDGAVSGKKLANAGLTMGYLYIGICILIVVLLILGVAGLASYFNNL